MRCDNDRNDHAPVPTTGRALSDGCWMKTWASMALALLLAVLVAPESQAETGSGIGFLGLSSSSDYAANLPAFRQGLRDLGHEEGKNISIEYRWAGNRYERLPGLAVELVRLRPDVLVTHAAAGIRAAQQATSTIPIVMGVSADPVRQGFVKSLARPGGNTTGVASQLIEAASYVPAAEQLVIEVYVRNLDRAVDFCRSLGFEVLSRKGGFAAVTWEGHRLLLDERPHHEPPSSPRPTCE